MLNNFLFVVPSGFFEGWKLFYKKDSKRLFVLQEDYYDVMDVKPKNQRRNVCEDFLAARNLPLAEHKVSSLLYIV